MDVHVITTQGCMAPANVRFKTYPMMRDWAWADGARLCASIRRINPSAILLIYSGFLYNDEPMITFAPTFIKRLVKRVPFVTQMEIVYPPNYTTFKKKITRKLAQILCGVKDVNYGYGTLLRDSDRIIALGPAHLEIFESAYPSLGPKSEVIPPPPLLRIAPANGGKTRERSRAKLGVGKDEFLLAFFGYADHNKGIDTLFNALKLLRRENAKVRLVMIGGGRGISKANLIQEKAQVTQYENRLLTLPDELGIGDAVTWLGGYCWESDEASEFLWGADACVLPFLEGATMSRSSLAAAAAHGLPLITTRAGSVERPLVHGTNVLLIPANNAEALSKAILDVMRNPDLKRRLACGADKLAAEWFSWELAVEKTINCLF
jgi:glycosyltransferase involved in cell wall biosynthesis